VARQLVALFVSLVFLALLGSARAADEGRPPAKKTVRADDGLNIVCEVRGHGDTALVFLHGWCGDRQYWKNQVDAFAKDYRVVTLDQAGHGESGKDRKTWTVDSLAGDAEAVVNALDLKRVVLVGHSMGGSVALAAAKRMPDKVVAVIGVDTLQNADYKRPEEMRKKFTEGFEKDFQGTLKGGFVNLLGANVDPQLKTWILDKALAQDQTMALALMRDMFALDTVALFKAAGKPIRCINSGGGYPFYVPTDVATNRKYADYNAIFIDSVGHYPMLEKPAEFNQKLRDVLAEFNALK
jgi:pimeloyl-ACP methyl ester carboxylesterase